MTTKKVFSSRFSIGLVCLLSGALLLTACSDKRRPLRVNKRTQQPAPESKWCSNPQTMSELTTRADCEACKGYYWNGSTRQCIKTGEQPEPTKQKCTPAQLAAAASNMDLCNACHGYFWDGVRCVKDSGGEQIKPICENEPTWPNCNCQGWQEATDGSQKCVLEENKEVVDCEKPPCDSGEGKDPKDEDDTSTTGGGGTVTVEPDPGDEEGSGGEEPGDGSGGTTSSGGASETSGGESTTDGTTGTDPEGAGGTESAEAPAPATGDGWKIQETISLPEADYQSLEWKSQSVEKDGSMHLANGDSVVYGSIKLNYALRPYSKVNCDDMQLIDGRENRDDQLASSLGYDGEECHPMPAVPLKKVDGDLYKKLVEKKGYRKGFELKDGTSNYIYVKPKTGQQLYKTFEDGSYYQSLKAIAGMQKAINEKLYVGSNDSEPKITDQVALASALDAPAKTYNLVFEKSGDYSESQINSKSLEFCMSGQEEGCNNDASLGKRLQSRGRGQAGQAKALLLAVQDQYKTCFKLESNKAAVPQTMHASRNSQQASKKSYTRGQQPQSRVTNKKGWLNYVLSFFNFKNKAQKMDSTTMASKQKREPQQLSLGDPNAEGGGEAEKPADVSSTCPTGTFGLDQLAGGKINTDTLFSNLEGAWNINQKYAPVVLGFTFVPDACKLSSVVDEGGDQKCSVDGPTYNTSYFKALHKKASDKMALAFAKHLTKPANWRPMSFVLKDAGDVSAHDITVKAYNQKGEGHRIITENLHVTQNRQDGRGVTVLHVLDIKLLKNNDYLHIVVRN